MNEEHEHPENEMKDHPSRKERFHEKITLPIAVILSAIVIGASLYGIQINKQQSIERQQQKDYIAKRTTDCLAIYKTESDKWNNALDWRFIEADDECRIRYKDPEPKTDVKCDELYSPEISVFGRQNRLCKEGQFEKVF